MRIPDTPRTVLAVKPVEVLYAGYQKPDLLDFIRDLYDDLATELGPHIVVCDPDPSWSA